MRVKTTIAISFIKDGTLTADQLSTIISCAQHVTHDVLNSLTGKELTVSTSIEATPVPD